jgi:hypothetical protein
MAFANPRAVQSRFLVSGSADDEMRLWSVGAGGQVPFPYGGSDGGQVCPTKDLRRRLRMTQVACLTRGCLHGPHICGPVDIAIIASGNRSIRLSDILDST